MDGDSRPGNGGEEGVWVEIYINKKEEEEGSEGERQDGANI